MKYQILFLMCMILLVGSVNAYDSELVSYCGGDDELIISCPNMDDELFFIGEKQPYRFSSGVPPQTIYGKSMNIFGLEVNNLILYSLMLFILLLLMLFLVMFLVKNRRK